MWILYAFLSAVLSSVTQILAKVGVDRANPSLANAVRLITVLTVAWLTVFVTGEYKEIVNISAKTFLILGISGVVTGISWIFFYKALGSGDVSRVASIEKSGVVLTFILAFIFFKEQMTKKIIAGCVLITAGILCLV
jgi:transporter family protein